MDQYQEYMGMAGLPSAYTPMMQYPMTQLESMYPRCYYVIYPRIVRVCDMVQDPCRVTPQMLQQMIDSIYDECEPMLCEDDMMEMDMQMMPQSMHYSGMDNPYHDGDTRQFGVQAGFFPGFFPRPRRRFLRDLISILLIRRLLRRRPFFGFGF